MSRPSPGNNSRRDCRRCYRAGRLLRGDARDRAAAGSARRRYTLGAVAALGATDPRAAYATPLLGQNGRFVQVALQVEELQQPQPPAVAYELVGADGVYAALADGEWERAKARGLSYSEEGVLLFVVPRDLQKARLEIVDYYYPRPTTASGTTPTAVPPLMRRVLATFAFDRLP